MSLRLLIALVFVATCRVSYADLVINISGITGSGETTWTFSGSSTASGTEFFDDNSLQTADGWFNIGDFFADTTFGAGAEFSFINTSATVTTPDGTRNINRVFFDDSTSVNGDEFALGVDGSSNLDFVNGEIVSWTGVAILSQDLGRFNLGTFGSDDFGTSTANNLPIQIVVSAVAVPEPGHIVLLACLGGFFFFFRRIHEKVSSNSNLAKFRQIVS